MARLLTLDIDEFSYPGSTGVVLASVRLALEKGELVGVMGQNGSGKTTLLNLCAGELGGGGVQRKATFGDRDVSFVLQDYRASLFPWKTALANICLPARLRGEPPAAAEEDARRVAAAFRLHFDLRKRPSRLSGGEQQKVCVLRSLLEQPRVLIMDEPTSAMDYGSRLFFMRALRAELKKRGTSALLVSHSTEEALLFCDRLLVLSANGTLARELDDCQSSASYLANLKAVHDCFLD